ncbi:nucleotide sugar dehydrogenase [Brevibacillus humidisoli]|uniref:nucleotide sugar dehydrogenase n=1 Tax=Brevibacillus humidisoli TaxID=2895522 RepID=UPI0021027FF6|nr:nucleotide sugar dehydrogenase [Brevibacillus humidisoli]
MKAPVEKAETKVGIVGLGYVGLPLAMLFVSKGVYIRGIDIDKQKIESIRKGMSYLTDITDEEVRQLVASGRFEPTWEYAAVRDVDAVILCVPTPLRDHAYPDLSYIQSAASSIASYMKPGQLIVLESSTFPGTTEEVLQPILEKHGKQAGIDFYLGYSPERIDPGNKDVRLESIPKVVSGITEACLQKLTFLYGQVFDRLVPVTSPRAAEMTKLLENCQRFVNISFVNEIAMVCEAMGIDIWEVIEAAKTKPYGFTPYYPGPGVGGHCIPVDPLYLEWKAKQYQLETKFIHLAKLINDQMQDYVVERISKHLPATKTLANTRLLLIGITYKRDVNDVRESTPLAIFEKLLAMGVDVSFYDPLVSQFELNGQTYASVDLTADTLKNSDYVVLLTDHTQLPYDLIVTHSPLLFDTRGAIKQSHPHVVRL